MKKIIKIISIFLIIAILIFIIYVIHINYDGILDKSNPMTRDEVIKLVKNGCNNQNYYANMITNEGIFAQSEANNKAEIYFKDNILKVTINGKTMSWTDYNKNQEMHFWGFPNVSVIKKDNIEERQPVFDFYSLEDKDEFGFEYLGEKQINERPTILIKLNYLNDKAFLKIFIDKKTGVIIEEDWFNGELFIPRKGFTRCEMKFDVVTDEDVKMPNIIGYNVLY